MTTVRPYNKYYLTKYGITEEGQSQLKILIDKNLLLQKELNKQYEIIKKMTNMSPTPSLCQPAQ